MHMIHFDHYFRLTEIRCQILLWKSMANCYFYCYWVKSDNLLERNNMCRLLNWWNSSCKRVTVHLYYPIWVSLNVVTTKGHPFYACVGKEKWLPMRTGGTKWGKRSHSISPGITCVKTYDYWCNWQSAWYVLFCMSNSNWSDGYLCRLAP